MDIWLISILVRTHNRSQLLKFTLESLLNQESINLPYEIIVIDNASTDNTRNVVSNFQKQNSFIRYVYEPVLGASKARKAGLLLNKSPIIHSTS